MVNWILLLLMVSFIPAARFMLYPLGFSRTLESCPSCVLALHVTGGGCETWLIFCLFVGWVSGFGGAIHNTTSEMTFLGFFLVKA